MKLVKERIQRVRFYWNGNGNLNPPLLSTATTQFNSEKQRATNESRCCAGARKMTASATTQRFILQHKAGYVIDKLIDLLHTHSQALWWLELELLVLFLWLLFSIQGCKFSQSTSIISGSSSKGEKMTLYYSQKRAAQKGEGETLLWSLMSDVFQSARKRIRLCTCVCIGYTQSWLHVE